MSEFETIELRPLPKDLIPVPYDIETYRNCFMAVFFVEGSFITFDGRQLEQLKGFLKQGKNYCLIGYNTGRFDAPVLKQIISGVLTSDEDIYYFAQSIIEGGVDQDLMYELQWRRPLPVGGEIDLMRLAFSDDETGQGRASLKEIAVRLNWAKIQDLPFPPDANLNQNQIYVTWEYCKNDVLVAGELYNRLYSEIMLRFELQDIFKLGGLLSQSNAGLCEIIFRSLYAKKSSVTEYQLRKLRTEIDAFVVGSIVPDWIKFKSPVLQERLTRLKSQVVRLERPGKYNTSALQYDLEWCGLVYSFGAGGIHSKDFPAFFEASPEEKIIEVDVASYYPSLLLLSGRHPEHLTSIWSEILQALTERRLIAKSKMKDAGAEGEYLKYKSYSDALKVVINAAFGKSGNRYSFMYDYRVLLSATLIGQLAILMLIEDLTDAGFVILSANTDGATARVPLTREKEFRSICSLWEQETKLVLEYTEYFKYFRLSISDYYSTTKGRPKRKGFFKEPDLVSKNDAVVIREAVIEFFENGTPPEETVKDKYRPIFDYLFSFKTTKAFQLEMHRGREKEVLQRVNRWYVSTDKKRGLLKRRLAVREGTRGEIGATISMNNSEGAVIANDLKTTKHPKDIDYQFYVAKAQEVIYQINILNEVERVQSLGLVPLPKNAKKNPRGARLAEIQTDWKERGVYYKYSGVGIYTGAEAGVLGLDIDYPEKYPALFDMLADTMVILHGPGTRGDVLSGKKRGTVLYKCDNPYLKSSAGKFFKKYGFEICFGKKPLMCTGIHPSNEIYRVEGELQVIPENLLFWLLENGPKIRVSRKKASDDKTQNLDFGDGGEGGAGGDPADPGEVDKIAEGYSPDEEEKDDLIFIVSELLPRFDYRLIATADRFKLEGHCPFADEHGGRSQESDFHIYYADEGQLSCFCFHQSCFESRLELIYKLNAELFDHKQLKARDEMLAEIELKKSIFDSLESKEIKNLLRAKYPSIMIEAPTGSGKTTESAFYFIECLQNAIPVAYVASNRTDQEQFVNLICEITGKPLAELFTQVLRGGAHLDEEIDVEGNVAIAKSTLGIITHHTYLMRKGVSLFFYPFYRWVISHKPVLLIDEADRLADAMSCIIPLQDRYIKRRQLGANMAEYWKVNQCPGFAGNGSCENCFVGKQQIWEVDQYSIPKIRSFGKVTEADWSIERAVETPTITETEKYWFKREQMEVSQVEQHQFGFDKKAFRFRINAGETHDSRNALRDLIDSAFYPVIYRYMPVVEGAPIEPDELTANDELAPKVKYPFQPCQIPFLSLKDRAPLELWRRYTRQIRFLTAKFSPSNEDFLRSILSECHKIKIEQSSQKIDELLILGYKAGLRYTRHTAKKTEVFFAGLDAFGKVLCFEPKKEQSRKLHNKLPSSFPAGCYSEDSVFVREKFAEGKWRALVTHSRGPLGRSMNLPQFFANFIKGLIYKPSLAFDLYKFNEEEINERRQADRISVIIQNAGRILRGNKGRKVIVLQYTTEEEIAELAAELSFMVREPIATTFFRFTEIIERREEETGKKIKETPEMRIKETILKWFEVGEVENGEPSIADMVAAGKTRDVTDEEQEAARDEIKSEAIEKRRGELVEFAENFEGTWREFSRVKNLSAKLRAGTITEEIVAELKDIFDVRDSQE